MAALTANNSKTTVSIFGIGTGTGSVTLANGSAFPAVVAPDTLVLTLDDGANVEYVLCTAHTAASTTLTIGTRALEGSTAFSFANGVVIEYTLTSGQLAAQGLRQARQFKWANSGGF